MVSFIHKDVNQWVKYTFSIMPNVHFVTSSVVSFISKGQGLFAAAGHM